ncbi:MAG: glycine cleavage system protein GcvH [Candidatus Omnitrophica bacterium]|nr:glycine cleavage system protein GcvH [Candidatus Omnitrophota bacterium]
MADLKFTKSHEWIRIEGDVVTTGITDYAQGQLGDIVFIELPKVGKRIKQLSQLGTIESTKAASELYAPISGEVIQANDELGNNPQWINESPLDQGWIAKIKIENQVELDNLMDEAAYEEFIGKEKK